MGREILKEEMGGWLRGSQAGWYMKQLPQVTPREHRAEATSSNPNSARLGDEPQSLPNGLGWGQNGASETGLRPHWTSWTGLGQVHIHEINFFISHYWPSMSLPSAEMPLFLRDPLGQTHLSVHAAKPK